MEKIEKYANPLRNLQFFFDILYKSTFLTPMIKIIIFLAFFHFFSYDYIDKTAKYRYTKHRL